MIEMREYVSLFGLSSHDRWFRKLNAEAAAKVTIALTRLLAGNTSNVKPVGEGVCELKVDFGPGYRVYFGWDGPQLIILLGGGIKKRQDRDIRQAQQRWQDYKRRKARIAICH